MPLIDNCVTSFGVLSICEKTVPRYRSNFNGQLVGRWAWEGGYGLSNDTIIIASSNFTPPLWGSKREKLAQNWIFHCQQFLFFTVHGVHFSDSSKPPHSGTLASPLVECIIVESSFT